jgi:outer membrane autotransporter barrel domain/autotransporter-associated beta strand repeat
MNHAYRVVWNGALGVWQAVSELAVSHTKGAGTGGGRKLRRRAAASALIALSLSLAVPLAHAANVLLVGSGGTGGGDGGNGTIRGGNGGQDFYLAGSGGAGGVPDPTQTISSPATGSSLLGAYDYVGIGGGAGGGDGGNLGGINGGTGGAGVLNLDGTTLNITNMLLIGGAGGGGGSGGAGGTRGGNGGKGGSGTLTATGGATITVGTQLYIGGLGGTGGNCGCSGNGGAGGNGLLNLGDGSTLDLTGANFAINGNGTLNIGNATANGAAAGTITGLTGSIANAGTINFNQSDASYTFSTAIAGTGKVVQNGSGTTFLAGANTYSGGTTINAGLINFTNGGNLGTGNITLNGGGLQWATANTTDISSRLNALGASGGTLDTHGNDVTLASGMSGAGSLTKAGPGTLTLTNTNTYTGGTTITNGTLALGAGGSLASTGSVNLANTGARFDISASGAQTIGALDGAIGSTVNLGGNTLTVNANINSIFGGTISGAGGVMFGGSGTQTLSGTNTYTGGTTISAGTLQIGNSGTSGTSGSIVGDVIDNGTLTFDRNDALDYTGAISGTGRLTQSGTGTLMLDGNSSAFAGSTEVQFGTLIVGSVAGNGAALGGDVTVDSGATLGGHGSIGGAVDVLGGAHLTPGNSIGTLTIGGDATFAQGSVLDFEFGAPGANLQTFGTGDSVSVGGNLELDGATLNVADAGGFGPGLYNLFSYGGTLTETNGGLALGSTPTGSTLTIQTLAADQQINLLDTTGVALDFWNANGLASNRQMGGGSGTWSTTSPEWTDATGSVTGAMQPQPGFAIFGGAPGTVTVDASTGSVSATGLQFAVDGYTLTGDTLTLVGSGGTPIVRVGDGSSAAANMTATIGTVIAGTDGLVKTDAGTLVLTGNNTYAGGTTISGGELSVAGEANLGAASGVLVLDGGALRVSGTAFTGTARAISMTANGGGFDITDAGNTFTVAQALDGNGHLVKLGGGTLLLTGANSYNGGTTIVAGTLRGDTGSLQGDIVDNAALVFAQTGDGSYAGSLSGSGSLGKTGAGTLTLGGDSHAYTGMATVDAGGLAVDGTLGGTLVMGAGTRLSGNGTLGNLDLAGTLAPGHSIGTLSASGDVTIRSGAAYEVETDAAGHSDLLAVTGRATLQGGSVLNLAQDGSYAANSTYTILTAGGGVDGQFADVTSSLAFLDPTLIYQANAVQLSLRRNQVDFCAVAATANQCATGTAVQHQGNGPLYDALVTQDAATARSALGQWSGESLASTRTALLQDSRFVREAMTDRLHRADTAQDDARALGESAGSIWLHGWDHSGHADGDSNASTLQSNGSGVLLGVDAPLGDWLRAGITGGVGQDSLRVDALDSSAYVKSRHLGVYAGGNWGAWTLDGGAAQSWHDIRGTRVVDAVLPGSARADYHGRTRQAYLEGGYRYVGAHGSVQPFVNLAHMAVHTGDVNEYGSVTALRSAGETTEVSFGTVGVHGLWQLVDNAATPASLYATLSWRHALGDLVPLAQQQFADGERFTVRGVPLAANAALVQLGIDAALSKHTSLRAGYDGVLAGRESDHAVRLTLQVAF